MIGECRFQILVSKTILYNSIRVLTDHSVATVEVEEDGDNNNEQDESAKRPGHRLLHHHLALRGSCIRTINITTPSFVGELDEYLTYTTEEYTQKYNRLTD